MNVFKIPSPRIFSVTYLELIIGKLTTELPLKCISLLIATYISDFPTRPAIPLVRLSYLQYLYTALGSPTATHLNDGIKLRRDMLGEKVVRDSYFRQCRRR